MPMSSAGGGGFRSSSGGRGGSTFSPRSSTYSHTTSSSGKSTFAKGSRGSYQSGGYKTSTTGYTTRVPYSAYRKKDNYIYKKNAYRGYNVYYYPRYGYGYWYRPYLWSVPMWYSLGYHDGAYYPAMRRPYSVVSEFLRILSIFLIIGIAIWIAVLISQSYWGFYSLDDNPSGKYLLYGGLVTLIGVTIIVLALQNTKKAKCNRKGGYYTEHNGKKMCMTPKDFCEMKMKGTFKDGVCRT